MDRSASSSDVAAALGVSSATVQRYARDGRIPFSETAGGHRRFNIDEVREALSDTAAGGVVRPRATAVILTALAAEFDAVRAHLGDLDVRRLPNGTRYYVGAFDGKAIDWAIALAEIGEGNLTAAAETTRAIDVFDPQVVLFVGVAGSLKVDVRHGDVVVANKVYRYHSGKAGEDFLSRPLTFPTWHGLEQLVRQVRRSRWSESESRPTVELKPIAAGEVVVASRESETFRLLNERCNDAVAVDMESAGVYEAAHRAGGRGVLAVRGISDMLSDKNANRDAHWQPVASQNAATFAFALLHAADPDDLDLRQPASPYSTERAELLSMVPPPVADVLEREGGLADTGLALLRVLADQSRSANRIVRGLLDGTILDVASLRSARLWETVAEFATAHADFDSASTAFEAAARFSLNPAVLLARSALGAAATERRERATALIGRARVEADSSTEGGFVDVVAAALEEDASRVVRAAEQYGEGDGLVDLFRVHGLRRLGREDEALDLAFRALDAHPNQSRSSGLELEAARLLLARAHDAGPGMDVLSDVDRAREFALRVRDVRRQWGGRSEEAAEVAALAAAVAQDFEAVIRLALPSPEGDATDRESRHQPLLVVAAGAAIAIGRPEQARDIAAMIDDVTERRLIEADCAEMDGAPKDQVVDLLSAALRCATTEDQQTRAYMELARTGVWPLEGLDELSTKDPDMAQTVQAVAELATGNREGGIRRLRGISTKLANSILVEAYRDDGKLDDAIDVLRDAAVRFSRPQYRFHAATMLATAGEYGRALTEASSALAVVPATNYLHAKLRKLCIEISYMLSDWSGMVDHARSAIAEGQSGPDIQWPLVGALFNQRQLHTSRQEMLKAHLQPRTEDEALLAIHLYKGEQPPAEDVAAVLDVAELFPDSETVAAAAFMTVIEMSRNADLPSTLAERIKQMSNEFFRRWPESKIVTRIDASDVNNLVDYLRATSSPNTDELLELHHQTILGQMPAGLIASARGRSLTSVLVTRALGCVPVGTSDPLIARKEVEIAHASLDGDVVADTHVVYVLGHLGIDPTRLVTQFSSVTIPRQVFDDALEAMETLRLRSTATMGWNPHEGKPFLIEIDEEQAEQWLKESEQIIRRANSFRRHETIISDPVPGNPRSGVVLAPVELAKQKHRPLWSDDPAIRQLARNEGVATFGSVALLEALRSNAQLPEAIAREVFLEMMRSLLVDLPFDPELSVELAEEEGWSGHAAANVLARPVAWVEPASALSVYRQCVAGAVAANSGALQNWSYAATLGSTRVLHADTRRRAAATLVLTGFVHSGSNPEALPFLLDGARRAAQEAQLEDPLPDFAKMLRSLLSNTVGEPQTPQLFAHMIAQLDDRDRQTALEQLLGRDEPSPVDL